jgi:hypothetical protein
MTISWPEDARARFGSDLLQATHSLGQSPLFCDASLEALLDAYPRDRLGVWAFADHGEGEEAPVKGDARNLPGRDILQAVKKGRIWLNLRATNQLVSDYSALGETIFESLQTASGQRVLKRDMSVLISSPGIHVHYHLDIPLVALFQVRGEKTVWFYPPTSRFAPDEKLEAIVLREQEEGLSFSEDFESESEVLPLKPGMGVTWPQNAPHRVQNGDMMNVSLSCEFMTLPGLIRANAIYANGRIRRQFGATLKRPSGMTPLTLSKAALARAIKPFDRSAPSEAPTPASFVLDLSHEHCVRSIEATV